MPTGTNKAAVLCTAASLPSRCCTAADHAAKPSLLSAPQGVQHPSCTLPQMQTPCTRRMVVGDHQYSTITIDCESNTTSYSTCAANTLHFTAREKDHQAHAIDCNKQLPHTSAQSLHTVKAMLVVFGQACPKCTTDARPITESPPTTSTTALHQCPTHCNQPPLLLSEPPPRPLEALKPLRAIATSSVCSCRPGMRARRQRPAASWSSCGTTDSDHAFQPRDSTGAGKQAA